MKTASEISLKKNTQVLTTIDNGNLFIKTIARI